MSFGSTGATIQEGDWVLVYQSRQSISSDIVTRGKEIQSKYGCFRHDHFVDKPWGYKLTSTNNRGFVYLLKPTPELWTLALPHRTQILYLPDIAFITSYLDVKPGSQIIEAGTGSGSFSHSLARTVGSTGQVHSFEYHEERFEKARDEFKLHGLQDVITIRHSNVYKDGFGGLEDVVDSVFLDLPAPWEALEKAKQAMRKDRQARICCFSPCIEQVIRTCSALAEMGFSDITMYETLTRTHDPVQVSCPPISSAIDRIKAVEVKKEKRREGQIEDAKKKREEKKLAVEATAAAVAAAAAAGEDVEGAKKRSAEDAGVEEAPEAKKVKVEGESSEDVKMDLTTAPSSSTDSPAPSLSAVTPAATPAVDSSAPPSRPDTPTHRLIGKPLAPLLGPGANKEDRETTFRAGAYARGHTSFLTFATLLPVREAERKPETAVVKEKKEGSAVEVEAKAVEVVAD